MADELAQTKLHENDGEGQAFKIKMERMDCLTLDLAAALSSVCDPNPDPSYGTQTDQVPSVMSSGDCEKESISASQADHKLFLSTNSIESFNSKTHCPLSSSKEDVWMQPLDDAFSALDVIRKDKDKLKCDHPKKLNIESRLLDLLLDSAYCSYKVIVGKYKFRCHLLVLQSHSKYFLRNGDPEKLLTYLPVNYVTPPAFHTIYNWMISSNDGKAKKKKPLCRSIVELISATKFLQINELLDFCWRTVDSPQITESVAYALFREAGRFDLPDLLTIMLSRVSKFFLTLVASQEFLDMDVSIACQLLAMHNLGVNSEIEIFMSILRWLSYEWPKRQPYLMKMMHCVRFGLLPPLFLRFLQNEQHTQVLHCICGNAEVQEMINKAFVYTTTELFCYEYKQRLQYLLPDCDLPEHREWIYDAECNFHQDSTSTQRQFFTYQQFLNYLQSLQEMGPNSWQRLKMLRNLPRSIEDGQSSKSPSNRSMNN